MLNLHAMVEEKKLDMKNIIYNTSNRRENKPKCPDWNYLFVINIAKCWYMRKKGCLLTTLV